MPQVEAVMFLADVQPFRGADHADKADEIVIVVQRLPGAHNHNVGHPLPGGLLDLINLSEHLRRFQIPFEPADGGCAKAHPIRHPAWEEIQTEFP